MEGELWHAGKNLITAFEGMGYEAYFVGGAVRNLLMGLPVEEIDMTTNAHPEVSLAHFKQAYPTGLSFGTVTIVWEGYPFEVTTFRKEVYGRSGRSPVKIAYSDTLTEDLQRRDFTINAMAMDGRGMIYDPFGGREDLREGLIRAVGDPKQRFHEDALRMLRAIRFATLLKGFRIEEGTWKAILEERGRISQVSLERIVREMEKILGADEAAKGVRLISEAGLLFTITDPSLLTKIGKTRDGITRLALLFSGINPVPEVPFSFDQLPLQRKVREEVRFLLTEWRRRPVREEREFLYLAYDASIESILRLSQFLSLQREEEPGGEALAAQIRALPYPEKGHLPLSGRELIEALQRPAGAWVGRMLKWLWEGLNFKDFPKDRDILIEMARRHFEEEEKGFSLGHEAGDRGDTAWDGEGGT